MKQRIILYSYISAVIALICILIQTGPSIYKLYTATFGKSYKVLVIHSFEKYYTWKDEINQGIKDGFRKEGIRADIRNEYINSEYLLTEDENKFVSKLLDKTMTNVPDLIIACDDQATYTLLAINHPLTYQTPVVFCGVDYPNKKVLDNYTNVTGFTTRPDYAKCFQLIKSIYPETKQFFLNTPEYYLGKLALDEFKEQTASMTEGEYKIRNLGILSCAHLGMSFTNPTQHAIMPIWDSFYSELVRNYHYPYFLVNNEGLGQGAIGGYMTPSYDQGYLAASRAVKILNGAPPASFGITPSLQKLLIDWVQMQRFNLKKEQLPNNAQIINMPIYIRYLPLFIIGCLLAIIIILGTTIRFAFRYRKEKRAKKQAYIHLQDHKNKLDIAMRSIYAGVISVDRDMRIFTMNRSALEWLGLDINDVAYKGTDVLSLISITTPNNKLYLNSMFCHLFNEYQDTTFPENTQLHSLITDQTISVTGEITGIYQEDELTGAVITFHDITQEIIQREFLSLTMSAGNVFTWQFDYSKGAFIFDASFFRQFNIPKTKNYQIDFQEIESLIHPDDLELLQSTITEVRAGQSSQITHQIRANLTGTGYTWWEFRLTAMSSYTKNTNALIYGLLFDIQSYKIIEKELVHAYTKAEQSEQLKSAFLANMSHEIRTPLNGIVGFSNLLTSNEDFELEDKKLFIDTINKNCNLLLALLSDILDLATIESNSMSFKFISTNVNELIHQIVITQRVIVPPELNFICQIPDETIYLTTDPLRLNQVITNLINNAVKFTTQGSITVGYNTDEPGYIHFYVEDTGKGIAPKDLESVFVRFFKKDDTTQGAGLGLSICKMIVDRFGGTIGVTSELDKGTRFTVRIPWKREEEKQDYPV